MKKLLPFETVVVDTHTFAAGTNISAGSVFDYFSGIHESDDDDVTQAGEEEIIKWLLATEARGLLFRELGVGADAFVDYSVKRPVIENPNDKPGDIDILICPGRRPDLAIALQCKPVIVKALNEEEDDDVKKLPRIRKLVKQANDQRDKYGFYRNYLAVLIKVDGRKKLKHMPLFRGATPETLKAIYEFPDREDVHDDVGIIFIEIIQPTGKSFGEYVIVGICVEKDATRLRQSDNLINRIEELMRRKGVTVSRI